MPKVDSAFILIDYHLIEISLFHLRVVYILINNNLLLYYDVIGNKLKQAVF